jgi:hypothetical protein
MDCHMPVMDDYLTKQTNIEQLMEILASRLGAQYTEIAPALLYENISSAEKGCLFVTNPQPLKIRLVITSCCTK